MRFWKFFGIAVLIVVVLLAVGITLTIGWRPIIGPRTRGLTDRRFEATPARLERGRYLATSVNGCIECHSQHPANDRTVRSSKPGAGQVFLESGGMRIVAENITPDRETGIGAWTDDEVARAIREGVDRSGRTLFPIMPYQHFHAMSDEDLASVVVYIRSLEPARHELPLTVVPFPVSRLINGAPEPLTAPVPAPDLSTPVKRGEYMVNMGACTECHTPMDEHNMPRADLAFAGGQVLEGEQYASGNITPDASGISYYDEALFISTMRTGYVKARQLKPPMPWWVYRNMTDEDLKSIFAYLRTVKAVAHRVDNSEPPTFCRVCRQKHGAGDKN